MAKNKQKSETEIVEMMIVAQGLAEETFGSKWDTAAVEEIADYLDIGATASELLPDLKRLYGHAQRIYKTDTPDSDQVFGLFDRVFD